MAMLRPRDVGVSSSIEETPTSPHYEDKIPSVNCKTVRGHQEGSGDLGNPISAFIIRSVRRSARLNARENLVPFSPGSNLEQEWPSNTTVNDGGDGTMVDGPNYSIKKNNGGSSRKGMGKGNESNNDQGKIKGKHNFSDT